MNICSHCGANLEDGMEYCPYCGTKREADYRQEGHSYFQDAVTKKSYTNREDSLFTPEDIQQNKILAIFAYLNILVFIPLILKQDSPFVRYHTNQGLVLFLCQVVYRIIRTALRWLGGLNFLFFGFKLASGLLGILDLLFFCMAIYGIINVCNGQGKQLPLIGWIRLLK